MSGSADRKNGWAGWLREHRVAAITGLAVLVLFLWLVLRHRGGTEEAELPAVVSAQTATAEVRAFDETLNVLGTVAPLPGHFAQMAAPAATRVSRIFVGVGDRVSAGQPLVALDQGVWAAQAAQAQAAFTAAQQAYDRAARLVAEGISARKDQEQAGADLAQARAALAEARRTESLGVLRSPIAGVVTKMTAALAQPVDANQPLVEVVDPSGTEILFRLSPDEAARVSTGAPVRFATGPDSASSILGTGVVRGINAAVDSTGSVAVRAVVDRPNRLLKVGESVTGRIVTVAHPSAVVVPVAALVPEGDAFQVWVVDAAGTAHATPVQVGARSETAAQILVGLRGGETVVAEGAYGVTDGAKIQPAGTP